MKFEDFTTRRNNRIIHVVLWISLALNMISIVALISAGLIFHAQLVAMDDTYLRCSVGIRWVERNGDRGKIIVIDESAMRQLQQEIEYELPQLETRQRERD